jgi:hypothetical protein
MRHLKPFNQLFEDLENTGETTKLNFSREDVKNRESYKDLIASGFKDVTPPRSGDGTFRFSHPAFDSMEYLIHTTGYIRRQDTDNPTWRNSSMVTQSVIPPNIVRGDYTRDESGNFVWNDKPPSNTSVLYGRPIKNPEDYDIKFHWLKRLAEKKFLKSSGISPISTDDESIKRELIKRELTRYAGSSPSATMKVKKMFPKIWAEIRSETGLSTLSDLGDLGF